MEGPGSGTATDAGAGVFALSLALMLAELVLTRIFSVTIWYHFAFFAIAVALFGAGAGALTVHLAARRLARADPCRTLSVGAILVGLSLAALDVALLRIPPDWFGGMMGLFTALTARLAAMFALTAVPFFIGGAVIALAIARAGERVHRVYARDLAGAAAGCLLAIPALSVLGGPRALIAAGVIACVSAAMFSLQGRGSGRWMLASLAVAGGLGVTLVPGVAPERLFALRVAKGLDLSVPFLRPEWSQWNAHSHVAVLPDHGFRGWGMSPTYKGRIPEQKTLVIDMNAMTALTRWDGDLDAAGHTWFDLSAFVYRVRPRADAVCVIGAGGGRDVLSALASRAEHVWAVELNPLIVDGVMRGAYSDFTGGIYRRGDVTAVLEDGRRFAHRAEHTFDVIQLSMVDTSAATAAGAYALTENGLYTREAMADYLAHLRPDGVLSMATVTMPGVAVGARLAALARAGLEDIGFDPRDSVIVLRSGRLYNLLVRRGAFTEVERAAVRAQARQLEFEVVFPAETSAAKDKHKDAAGLDVEARWIRAILGAESAAALAETMDAWPLDLSPPTDDRPFFFYQDRLRNLGAAVRGEPPAGVGDGAPRGHHLLGGGLGILVRVVGIALTMVTLCFALPVIAARHREPEVLFGAGRELLHVSALGLGFMFVEIALLQRLGLYLGQPTTTLAVVLAGLLLGGGLGSRLFAGAVNPRRAGLYALLAVVAYLAAVVQSDLLTLLLAHTQTWTLAARAVVTALVIVPLAVAMGAALPSALRVVSARQPARVPWMWAVNAATSVLGAVLATVVAIHAGLVVAGWVGVAFYGLAFASLPRH